MNVSTPNHVETENPALMYNKNIEKMWFWRSLFVFFICRQITEIECYLTNSNLAHPNYVKTSGKKFALK